MTSHANALMISDNWARSARSFIVLAVTVTTMACAGQIDSAPPGEAADGGPISTPTTADATPTTADATPSTTMADALITPPSPPVCGDAYCDVTENSWECSDDCGTPSIPADFAGVVWLHTDVSSWAQTATLSNPTNNGSTICLPYDKTDVWPGLNHVGAFVNGNPWIFIYREGVIYAATWEWLRHGQTCKAASSVAGDHIKQDPFWDFQPQSGTWYGFMVSGLARDSTRNAQERSNAVLMRWP